MYKNIILVVFMIFIAACSTPKVIIKQDTLPTWYTTVPSDNKFIYSVASSDTIKQAKKIAIVNMRKSLSNEINKSFKNKNIIEKIQKYNVEVANRLALNRVKLEKYETFKGKKIVLISIPRKDLFNKIKIISDIKLNRAYQAEKKALNKSAVERFIALDLAMKEWFILVSLAEYKSYLISTYNADAEFEFLNKMKKEYNILKNSINFYILTDGNSSIFSKKIKNAIKLKGLHVNSKNKSINNFKVLVTSKTEESQEYGFNQSKTLIKISIFDNNKKQIKFRQHTFIGKSKVDYKQAKEQAVIHLGYKIKKIGIFNFMGFNK